MGSEGTHGRDPDALLLHSGISRNADRPLVEVVGEYAALGVEHLHLSVTRDSEEATLDELARVAAEVLPAR